MNIWRTLHLFSGREEAEEEQEQEDCNSVKFAQVKKGAMHVWCTYCKVQPVW